MTDLTQVPLWMLDRMLLPRGGCSEAERKAAQQEIKRRVGLPQCIKMPKPAPPEPRWLPGFGWAIVDDQTG